MDKRDFDYVLSVLNTQAGYKQTGTQAAYTKGLFDALELMIKPPLMLKKVNGKYSVDYENYQEQKERQQKEVNALPLHFAFSKKQLIKVLTEWGITEEEAKAGAVYNLGAGTLCKAADYEFIMETLQRHGAERQASIKADTTGMGFVYSMFLYELYNREFGYTGEVWDTLDALNITLEDIEESEQLKTGFEAAKKRLREQ